LKARERQEREEREGEERERREKRERKQRTGISKVEEEQLKKEKKSSIFGRHCNSQSLPPSTFSLFFFRLRSFPGEYTRSRFSFSRGKRTIDCFWSLRAGWEQTEALRNSARGVGGCADLLVVDG
jgi:hypothetical protein